MASPYAAKEQARKGLETVALATLRLRLPAFAGRIKLRVFFRREFHYTIRRTKGGVSVKLFINPRNSFQPGIDTLISECVAHIPTLLTVPPNVTSHAREVSHNGG
jgi:hypothetical protein